MGGRPLLMAALPEKTALKPGNPVSTGGRPLIDVILDCLDDAKAEETVAVDITGKSSLADHMIVTSGRSQRHVGAVADQLVNALRAALRLGAGRCRRRHRPYLPAGSSRILQHREDVAGGLRRRRSLRSCASP
jgi:hypothetical protein